VSTAGGLSWREIRPGTAARYGVALARKLDRSPSSRRKCDIVNANGRTGKNDPNSSVGNGKEKKMLWRLDPCEPCARACRNGRAAIARSWFPAPGSSRYARHSWRSWSQKHREFVAAWQYSVRIMKEAGMPFGIFCADSEVERTALSLGAVQGH
jgi:hypothetical protein